MRYLMFAFFTAALGLNVSNMQPGDEGWVLENAVCFDTDGQMRVDWDARLHKNKAKGIPKLSIRLKRVSSGFAAGITRKGYRVPRTDNCSGGKVVLYDFLY